MKSLVRGPPPTLAGHLRAAAASGKPYRLTSDEARLLLADLREELAWRIAILPTRLHRRTPTRQ